MRLGRRAAARRAAGGPAVVGRDSLSVAGYALLKGMLWVRADARCERCRSRAGPLDPEHVVPRSAGGADSWANLWVACRYGCHRLKEAPYATGRLLVEPQGDGRFKFLLVRGTKYDYQVVEVAWGGRAPDPEEARALAALV